MNYFTALILLFGGLGATALGLYFLYDLKRREKLQKISKLPFGDNYKKILLKTPHYSKLPDVDKEKIQRSILLFIHTKEFVGVDMEVNDEMKILIAFYACLLLLHIDTPNCYDKLKTIIIYPHTVVSRLVHNNGGIYSDAAFLIEGQSANDTVVISWDEAKKEAYHLRHNNVIIHEFTHEIDFMDGEIDGVPPLEKSKYHAWVSVLDREFDALSAVTIGGRDEGKYKLLGDYAATNEAEFFAVTTERFFESPKALQKNFPELYNELKSFYKIDTAALVV